MFHICILTKFFSNLTFSKNDIRKFYTFIKVNISFITSDLSWPLDFGPIK